MVRLWILGASDPELEAIEGILAERGEVIAYATFVGRADEALMRIVTGGKGVSRVHPGNAYKADSWDVLGVHDDDLEAFFEKVDEYVYVECGMCDGPLDKPEIHVDHHLPGDPGFGGPPTEFWESSSIGQVYELLGIKPGKEQLFIAAADHCPAAAYQGKCPGVQPDELADWRIRSRAAFQGCTESEVRRRVLVAMNVIDNAPTIDLGDIDIADVREQGQVPELPEACLRLGRAVLYRLEAPDGRMKIGIIGAGEGTAAGIEPIEAFLDGWAASQGLIDMYGDCVRGYCGSYERGSEDS